MKSFSVTNAKENFYSPAYSAVNSTPPPFHQQLLPYSIELYFMIYCYQINHKIKAHSLGIIQKPWILALYLNP